MILGHFSCVEIGQYRAVDLWLMKPELREPPLVRTEIVCQDCGKPVAEIEKVLPTGVFFLQCPACGHWWTAQEAAVIPAGRSGRTTSSIRARHRSR